MQQKQGQIVIYGKHEHAEVIGLAGQTENTAIIVDDDKDLDNIDFSRPIRLFAQTTKSIEGLQHIENMIRERMKNNYLPQHDDFKSYDTVCRQVANRSNQLKAFAQKFDVILFVSDKKSSNGIQLFNNCKSINQQSYFISNAGEIKQEWFINAASCGICGATSTPLWLMEEIAEIIQKF
jgi:4-hydroxy-3-methylbut-2-enyl diphosphate reductase